MEQTQLSRQAHQRLTDEMEWRSTQRRQEISAWLEKAREHGDIRENADYDAAKNEQGHNEARVRHISAILQRAVIVEAADETGVAAAGTIVEVRIADEDDTSAYLIGSIEERREDVDVISPGSPLGQALMGHGPGDVVEYSAPGGTFSVEIVNVRSA